jgi:hypothetical protein
LSAVARCGLLIAAIACVLGACSRPESPAAPQQADEDYFSVERIKLPGFSMDAPRGEVEVHSKSPSAGKYKVSLPDPSPLDQFSKDVAKNSNFVASWTSDASTREDWDAVYLEMFAEALKKIIPGSHVLHREEVAPDRWFVIVGNDRHHVGTGAVRCDAKFQVDITVTRYYDVQRMIPLVKQLLRSVRCEVTDENRAGLAPVTRLPPNFGWVSTDDTWMFRTLEGETLVLNFTSGQLPDDPALLRPVYLAMLKQVDPSMPESSFSILEPGRHVRPGIVGMSRATLRHGNQIYVGSLFCEPVGATLMFIWSAGPRQRDDLAWQRLGEVDCPGAPSTPVLKFSEVAEKACASGDAAACAISDELKK